MLIPRPYLIFFLKISILTIVFSIFALLFLSHRQEISYTDHETRDVPGETMTLQADHSLDQTQVDTLIEGVAKETIEQEHYSANTEQAEKQYQQICTRYETICKKTTRDGTYSDAERLQYQALIIYLLKKENQYLQAPNKVENRLSYLKLYKDSTGRR